MRFRLVVFAFAALLGAAAWGFDCPPPCYCFPDPGDTASITIDCRGLELRELPFPIPESASHLDVSGNEIQFIRAADFPEGGLPRLRFLQLQNNDLMGIEGGALARLPNLQVLLLYNNRIPFFRSGVFDGLSNLQILDAHNIDLEEVNSDLFADLESIVEIDLSFNLLSEIPRLTFTRLYRLQRLDLNDNFITNLQTIAIYNLPNLRFLNLANNQLRTITPRGFTRIKNIRMVLLEGNPTECGCDAIWLLDFLQRKRLLGPECVNPAELRGERLILLNQTAICRFPTAEIIGSREIVVFNGTDIALGCLLSGAPFPSVTWSRDGMTLDLEAEGDRIVVNGSMLFISEAQVGDSGSYFCTAVSTAGEVASVARVTVIDRLAEDNVTVESVAGNDVVLDCSPGLPLGIEVMWEFEGVPLVPSAKHMFLRNGSLEIINAELSDIGSYVCLVDGVLLTRSLDLAAAPMFIDFPEGPCTDPTVVTLIPFSFELFPCTAFGIPAPTMTWFCQALNCFEDVIRVDPSTDGGGSTTVLVDFFLPAPEQSGNYTCVATNEHGTVSRSVTVSVLSSGGPGVSPTIELRNFVGETIVLLCDPELAFADRDTVFSWMRFDGIPIPAERAEFQARNSTLILRDLMSPIDIAGYICTIMVPSGEEFMLTYSVAIFEVPTIEMTCPLLVTTALIHDTVSLRCEVSANPPVVMEWFVNGTPISQAIPANRTAFSDNNQVLTISLLEEGDSGLYECLATNRFGNDSFVQELSVQVLPFFRFRPERVAVTAGQLARLWCGGAGNPLPSVTWFFQRSKTSGFQEVATTTDGRVLVTGESLVIVSTISADQGKYFCNLTSTLGSRMSPVAFLRVYTPPTIPALPTEFRVPVGRRNLGFNCFGSGDPAPVINWLMGSTILPINGIHVQLSNGTLVFTQVESRDEGVYRCRVANVGGADYLDVRLIVDTLPETRVLPPFIEADVGCQVIFLCLDGETPAGSRSVEEEEEEIEWRFNNVTILPSDKFLIRQSGELVISDVALADSGEYSCTIPSRLGNVTATAALSVMDPLIVNTSIPSPPVITFHSPEVVLGTVGIDETFLCQSDGFPEPVFSWFVNGEPAAGSPRVSIANGALIAGPLGVIIEDEGVYTCVATNALGSASQNFTLSIAWVPEFVVVPDAMALREFDMLRLDCVAMGFPDPSILWLLDGVEIVPDERIFIYPNGSLSVLNVRSPSDEGVYSCLARNLAGDIEFAVSVTVGPVMVSPNITEPPRSVVVATGKAFVLDCIVTGVPTPVITWLMNGLPLATVDSGGSVVIATATEEDEGSYTCIAENEAGRSVYSAFVTVETVQQATYPVFVVFPTSRWVSPGSFVEIPCAAEGSPPPNITWLYASLPLVETDNLVVDGNGTLIIFEASENETGEYVCQASNEAGVNQVGIQIDLREEGGAVQPGTGENDGAPVLTSFPVALLSLVPLQRAVLDCSASGRPAPQVTWLRDGLPLETTSDTNLQRLVNGSLVIVAASAREAGLYTCLATNPAGSVEGHVRVEVRGTRAIGSGELPEFTVFPHNITTLAGSKVTIDCQAVGSPEPYIIWTNGSRPLYENNRIKLPANGSLLVLSTRESDAGRYACRAANRAGAKETAIVIAVNPRREPPFFTVRPGDTTVLQGSYFMLHCEAMSAAGGSVNIQWSYGRGQAIGGREKFDILSSGDLLVTNTVPEDTGEYTCVARNEYGNSSSSAIVRILRHPLNSSSQVLLGSTVMIQCEGGGEGVAWMKDGGALPGRSVVYDDTVWIFGARLSDEGEYRCEGQSGEAFNHLLKVYVQPSIAYKSTLVVVQPGDTASLDCLPEGKPHPLLSWQRGGLQLERDGTRSILSNGTLLVYSVGEGDSGQYVCVAESEAGRTQASVLLRVTTDGS